MNTPTDRPAPITVSRRTIATGLAWSVPTMAAVSAAPAFAASHHTITNNVCQLFYGAGSVNTQTHSIHLGVASSSGTIPAGTELSWTVTVGTDPSGRASMVPVTDYSPNASWDLTLSQTTGSVGTFTATLRFKQEVVLAAPNTTWCGPTIIWDSSVELKPRAPITVTSNGVIKGPASVTSGGTGTLSYIAARRYAPTINDTGRAPHIYSSRAGVQTCYPAIQWSRLLSRNGYDNATTYPAGITPPGTRGTWNGTSVASSPTGQSTPVATSTVQSNQYVTAAVC